MSTVQEYTLANIARVDVETETETYMLSNMANEVDIKVYIAEGDEKTLRNSNAIKAANRTEAIAIGYDVTLAMVTMQPVILALIDGGIWDDSLEEYVAPRTGIYVEKIPFALRVYTEEKDADGSTLGYICFTFLHCKGQPVNYSLKDAEFFVEELLVKSRPKSQGVPIEINHLDRLPPPPISEAFMQGAAFPAEIEEE